MNRPRNNESREAIDEYRLTIRQILKHLDILEKDGNLKRPYLHLAIHGMKNDWNKEIEIGTRFGKSCSKPVRHWFINELKKRVDSIGVDNMFPGDLSKTVHRLGDKVSDRTYLGYGNNFNTLQVELSLSSRQNHQREIIIILSDLILNFSEEFK